MTETKNKKKFTSVHITAVSFLILIFIGSFLLSLPMCNEKSISYIDALFTAVSSVCVTGLSTLVETSQFTFWGELIILILIQIGGLGFMTFVTLIFVFFKKRITLKERILLGDSFGSNALKGLIRLTKRVFFYTLIIESAGAVLIAIKTIPLYGIKNGIWRAVCVSVSSFCNAGLELFGDSSMINFVSDKLISNVIMILTVLGGLGFLVWNEVREKIEYKIKNKISLKKMINSYSVHTKMVFSVTFILIVLGMISILIVEHNNEATIANMSFSDKLYVSLFQSINSRTSGITAVPIKELTPAGKIITIFLMFIGGAPGSTAGGIKTVTFGLIVMTAISVVLNKKRVNIFKREISEELIKKAVTLLLLALTLVFIATVVLTITEKNIDTLDLAFEAVSAFSTCGLSASLTPLLSSAGKITIMVLMYVGRVTTITMTMAIFKGRIKEHDVGRFPQEDIMIG